MAELCGAGCAALEMKRLYGAVIEADLKNAPIRDGSGNARIKYDLVPG